MYKIDRFNILGWVTTSWTYSISLYKSGQDLLDNWYSQGAGVQAVYASYTFIGILKQMQHRFAVNSGTLSRIVFVLTVTVTLYSITSLLNKTSFVIKLILWLCTPVQCTPPWTWWISELKIINNIQQFNSFPSILLRQW